MKRSYLVSFIASIYMFAWFFLAHRIGTGDELYDYRSPAYILAFVGFMLIYFIAGQKLCKSFGEGFRFGFKSFIIIASLNFLYTYISLYPIGFRDGHGYTIYPYTPTESIFAFLDPMFYINAHGFIFYIGDEFYGRSYIFKEQIIGLAVMFMIVSVVTGLGAAFGKFIKQQKIKESKDEANQI